MQINQERQPTSQGSQSSGFSFDHFSKIGFNKFYIDDSPQTSICCECRAPLQKGQIRIDVTNTIPHVLSIHLKCFKPKQKSYIRKYDIEYGPIGLKNRAKFVDWLLNWNNKFSYALDAPLPVNKQYLKRNKDFGTEKKIPMNQVRYFLEIFKFFKGYEIASVFTRVSKQWYIIAWKDELWAKVSYQEYNQQLVDQKYHMSQRIKENWSKKWKRIYIELYNQSCFVCKQFMQDVELCPILEKPICIVCRNPPLIKNEKECNFVLLTPVEIKRIFGISTTFLNQNKEKFVGFGDNDLTLIYYFSLCKFLDEEREKRKKLIVDMLHKIPLSPEEEKLISKIETTDMHKVILLDGKEIIRGKMETKHLSQSFQILHEYILKGEAFCSIQAAAYMCGVTGFFGKRKESYKHIDVLMKKRKLYYR